MSQCQHLHEDNDDQLKELVKSWKQLKSEINCAESLYRLIETMQYLHCNGRTDCESWRTCCGLLIDRVRRFKGLATSSHRDYYDILAETLDAVLNQIDKFNLPAESDSIVQKLEKWINYGPGLRLWFRIQDLYRIDKKSPWSINHPVPNNDGTSSKVLGDFLADSSLDELQDRIAKAMEEEKRILVGARLKEIIIRGQDPRLLESCSKKYPKITHKELAERHLCKEPPETFDEIAIALEVGGVNPRQVTARLYKKKTLPLLQEIARELGAQIVHELEDQIFD